MNPSEMYQLPYQGFVHNKTTEEFEDELCKYLCRELSEDEFISTSMLQDIVKELRARISTFLVRNASSENMEKKRKGIRDIKPEEWGSYLMKKTWQTYRGNLSLKKRGILRLNLYGFGKFLMGAEKALRIRLPFLPSRRLVVPFRALEGFPLDVASEIVWKCRMVGLSDKRARKENLFVGRLLIELLWQGIKVEDSLKLIPLCFDRKKKLLYLLTTERGMGYGIAVLSPETWVFTKPLLRHLHRWFRRPSRRNMVNLRELVGYNTAKRSVRIVLAEALKELGLSGKFERIQERIRYCGILHHLLTDDFTPIGVSSCFGIERQANVMGPLRLFRVVSARSAQMMGANVRVRAKAEESVDESHLLEVAPLKSERAGALWKIVGECRKEFRKYEEEVRLRIGKKERRKRRKELQKKLLQWESATRNIIKENDSSWLFIFPWLSSLVGQGLKWSGIIRYMETVCNLLDFCLTRRKEIIDLTNDDLRVLMMDEDGIIGNSSFKNTKNGVMSFFRFLPTIYKRVPEIDWDELSKEVDRSPRPIEIPKRRLIVSKVMKLSRGNEREKDAARVGIMSGLMGMRLMEITSVQVQDVRLIDGENDYLVVYRGKGDKSRKIFLSVLSPDIKKIFVDLYQQAVNRFFATGRRSIFARVNTRAGVGTLFDDYFREIAPDGIHTMRHAFGSDEFALHHPILDTSVTLGHATLRTYLNNYNQCAWMEARRNLSSLSVWDRLPLKTMTLKDMSFLTGYAQSNVARKLDEERGKKGRYPISEGANRKKGDVEWLATLNREVWNVFFEASEDHLDKISDTARFRFLWMRKRR